jgi:hypothetical protein
MLSDTKERVKSFGFELLAALFLNSTRCKPWRAA